MNDEVKKREKTGTREWAAKNMNVLLGCPYRCRYCYARAMALRFKRIRRPKEWGTTYMRIAWERINRPPRNVPGWVMFPSTHDITPTYMGVCAAMIRGLLDAGNRVLIASKPDPRVIGFLLERFRDYRDRLLFRFTITASQDDVLAYWEPGAPDFMSRMLSLKLAYESGFDTSVSCEPMLDRQRVRGMFYLIEPYVTETVWIGTMRGIPGRLVPGTDPAKIRRIQEGQTAESIRTLYEELRGHPHYEKIRWKDSCRRLLGRMIDD